MRKDFPQKLEAQKSTSSSSDNVDKKVNDSLQSVQEVVTPLEEKKEESNEGSLSFQEVIDMVRGNLRRGNLQRADELLTMVSG